MNAQPADYTCRPLYMKSLPAGRQGKSTTGPKDSFGGYIIKTGPGYVLPMHMEDESWKGEEEQVKYIPLQAKEGDLAIFLVSGATEVIPIAIGMKMKNILSFLKARC